MKLENNYFILRHGEAKSNKFNFVSCLKEKTYNPLTSKGRKQIERLIPILKKEKIDLTFSSDVLRAKQTAKIVAEGLGLKVNFDKRLREIRFGILNGKSIEEWRSCFKNRAEKFTKRVLGAENRRDVKKRMTDFLKEIDKKYKNKNILIVSHEDSSMVLQGTVKGFSEKEMTDKWKKLRIKTGEYKKL